MDKFQNKYRIPSARATWWNYASNGLYFITICTAGREHYFGVKKYATTNKIDFAWKSRFHDHIIRNNREYNRIQNYIVENPNNWARDRFFKNE